MNGDATILGRTLPRVLVGLALLALFGAGAVSARPARGTPTPVISAVGEKLYLSGVLPSGAPLRGERDSGAAVEGLRAACVSCHRRSGLGASEGRILIPPITAKYLFRERVLQSDDPELHGGETLPPRRSPYTDESLARAIRAGVGPDGRRFDALMPRFDLDDATTAELIAYLRQLSGGRVPGVGAETLQFATVITPDADPARRAGTLAVLDKFFGTKNMFFRGESPPLQSARNIHYRIKRDWQLHVWELHGAADTWEQQLRERMRGEPVFALISGVGGSNWAPVHRFCETEKVPCILPNVDLPVVAEGDFYSVYYSRGVLLESQLLAHRLAASDATGIHRVVQVYRNGDIGAAAAAELHAVLAARGLATIERALPSSGSPRQLAGALKDVGAADAVVLWLRADDIKALPAQAPGAGRVFASGLMGGLERAPLPDAWRATTEFAYTFDLPAARGVRMNYPLGWFAIRHIDVIDERVQTDTYYACVILAETLGPMLDNFVRDHLIERLETMMSSRILNGYYPRLGLGPGQRFASKGGYLVHFTDAQGPKITADGPWVVP